MSRKYIQIAFSILLLAGMALGFAIKDGALAQDNPTTKFEAGLLDQLKAGPADFIVMMKEQADVSGASQLQTKIEKGQYVFDKLVATAGRTQTDLRAYLDKQGVDYQSFYIVNAIWVKNGTLDLAQTLGSRTDVATLSTNHKYQLDKPINPQPSTAAPQGVEPNLSFINVDDVWAMGIKGAGMVVADDDTGLDNTHPAIAPHYRGCVDPPACTNWDHNYNWWDAFGSYATPYDDYGHGTHTAGTMVGDDYAGNQIGVAPEAKLISCKNMVGGSGDDAHFIICFQWNLAPWDSNGANPRVDKAPDSVNNSWGYWGGGVNAFREVIDNLQASGVLVEVSAGNEGTACTTLRSPGDYQEVLTTGSVDHQGQTYPGVITYFSSRGPSVLDGNYFPDIMAPGNNIRSSLPGGNYEYWSGTSMAGPHSTALISLIWSASPALRGQVQQTIDIIHETAVPLTGQNGSNCGGDYSVGPNNDWGYGTIDALGAVQLAIALGGSGQMDGTVRNAVTGDPIEGATVNAVHSQGFAWSAETSATGYYTMTVAPGTFDVTASHPQYESASISGVEVITDQLTTVDFELTPRGTLFGYVTDFDNTFPLVGATVTASDGTNTTTNDIGYYEMFLDEGTYTVTATMKDYADKTAVVDIVSGESTQQDFALQAAIAFIPSPAKITLDWNTVGTLPAEILNRQTFPYDFELREKPVEMPPLGTPTTPQVSDTPRSGDSVEVQALTPQSSKTQASGCMVALTVGTDPIESQELHNTLDELGFPWVDVYSVQEAIDAGANVLIDHYAAYNLPASDIANWLALGYGYVEMGDWPQWFPDAWEGVSAGTPVNIQVMDDSHPLMDGLPSSWTGLGFWAYDWPGYNAIGWVTDPSYPNLLAAGAGSMHDRAVTYQEVGDGKAVYLGVNVYGYLAGDNDKQLFRNAIGWSGGCGSQDVPWLAETPISGTVPAAGSMDVTLTFSATVAAGIKQPGDYLATLQVKGTPSLDVPVVMTVNAPATWGKLDGTVTDLCTGEVLQEVAVSIPDGVPITQTVTNDVGYYHVWLEQGTYDVSYSTAGYITQDVSLEILPGETTTHDVKLVPDRACIKVDPTVIEAYVVTGTQEYTTGGFVIGSIGAKDLNWEIREKDGGYSPGSVNAVPASAPLPAIANPGTTSVLSLPSTFGTPLIDPNSPNAWVNATPYPEGIVRYAQAQCPGDFNSFYIIAGVSNGALVYDVRRFDANTNTWTDLASISSTTMENPSGVCFEGKIYATSGGYGAMQFNIYDIASNTWGTGAALPRSAEGAAMAGWNGKIYLIGGDDDYYPGSGVSDQVNIYDIATDTWYGTGATMPIGIGNMGFVQLGQYVFVVGGWWSYQSPGTNSNMTLRYDIEGNVWEEGPAFTPARADFPIAATSQYLYAIGGDQSGAGYWDSSNTVYRYDFNAWPGGAWEDVNDPIPFALQAMNANYTTDSITGGEIWNVGGMEGPTFTWHAENIYRAAEPPWSPVPTDVPWVWEIPISGTLVPNSSMEVGVYLTAMSDTVPLPLGTYTATLRVLSNDSVAGVQNVTVVMHIVEAYVLPEASFTWTTAMVGEPTIFTNTTIAGIPPSTTFEWNFGDGTAPAVGTWDPMSHLYATFGRFTVSLKACNEAGCTTFTKFVDVLPKVILLPLINKN